MIIVYIFFFGILIFIIIFMMGKVLNCWGILNVVIWILRVNLIRCKGFVDLLLYLMKGIGFCWVWL